MYNLTAACNITKEDVLKTTSEYTIFCDILGYQPVINKLYNSPLRVDPRPSFGIFIARTGKLLYKDLGTGDSGDCFKLASILSSTSVTKVLRELYNKSLRIKSIIYTPIVNTTETEIAVHPIPFTEQGLNYWGLHGISVATLNKFNVEEIDKFWINGQARGWKTKNNLLFSYSIYNKYKIYKPLDREYRFVNNCSIYEIQGWEQLDYTKDTVIITKSLKDIMLLHELGYTAIAPGGEGQSLPEEALEILRKNFKYIIVFYDKDKAGLITTKKMLKKNPDFGFMFTYNKEAKDITDFYVLFGKPKTVELLSKKIEYVKTRQYGI